MKLVLLPGMDGTGELFKGFLEYYEGDAKVIPLPMAGRQEYAALAGSLIKDLPNEEFILLAESFSGGIVQYLLKHASDRIKGVIFVASFLSPPNRLLLQMARRLPLQLLAGLPFSKYFHKAMFLGMNASDEFSDRFIQVLRSMPEQILKRRIKAMADMRAPAEKLEVPAIYIQAREDKLINRKKWLEFQQLFKHIVLYQIPGPHFILQANPSVAAVVVSKGVSHLRSFADPLRLMARKMIVPCFFLLI
ncbi:MAG: lysophospholipase [Candidatus Thiodiazotropha sp. (ex Epidulcina cf. delphinae)]|nr:lysophospholipase [Candidatus Thiodiazotropha sp. (ex Epidulcina cf. delphinae)]